MSQAICILCGTNDFARELYPRNFKQEDLNPEVFSARRSPDRLHETMLRCARCGLVYPTTLLDSSRLKALYEASLFNYGSQEMYIRHTYGLYLRKVWQRLKGRHTFLSYLDIGCGNGFMLSEARSIGFVDVAGVEPSAHAIAQASSDIRFGIVQGMFSPQLFGSRRFDVLSCFQTLDHIQDPKGFAMQCFSVLKPGGAVLFINHNIDSLFSRILGERCPMIDIEHTYLHTPKTMRMLFEQAGYVNVSVFAVRNDYPLSYWLYLLPIPSSLKKFLGRVLHALRLQNVIVPLYAGNLGLIAERPL